MESIKYLIEKLKILHDKCENLNIRYEYKSLLNTHVIDVRPKDVFENEEFYAHLQLSLEDEFENLYPLEEILFISNESLMSIDKAIFEIKSVEVQEINVQDFTVLEVNKIHFEDFINVDIDMEYIAYNSLEEIDYVQVESDLDNEIIIHSPPPKPWWKFKTNKKDSKKDLEFFFT